MYTAKTLVELKKKQNAVTVLYLIDKIYTHAHTHSKTLLKYV